MVPLSPEDADGLEAACLARAEVMQKAGLPSQAAFYAELATRVRRTVDTQHAPRQPAPVDRTEVGS